MVAATVTPAASSPAVTTVQAPQPPLMEVKPHPERIARKSF
jgi:hypothetical protein